MLHVVLAAPLRQAVTLCELACVCRAIFAAADSATGRALLSDGALAHTAAGIATQAMQAVARADFLK